MSVLLFTLMHYRALTDAFYSLCITMKLLFVVKKMNSFVLHQKVGKKIETAAGNPYFLPTLLLGKIEMMMR